MYLHFKILHRDLEGKIIVFIVILLKYQRKAAYNKGVIWDHGLRGRE